MKETIVQKMKSDIIMIDIRMNTNLDKWYKIAETGVIDEETAKKLRKLMRGDPKEFKKKDKKLKKKFKKLFIKRLQQIHNIIIGYTKDMWVDRTQAIKHYLKTLRIREEINNAKKEAMKKRKKKREKKEEQENQEIDLKLSEHQEESDPSDKKAETREDRM
jgi:hypothetical protein